MYTIYTKIHNYQNSITLWPSRGLLTVREQIWVDTVKFEEESWVDTLRLNLIWSLVPG